MKKLLLLLVCATWTKVQAQDPQALVAASWNAHGGAAWDTVNIIKARYFSHLYWLEQSESPEGPYITSYSDVQEVRSLRESRLYQKKETKYFFAGKPDNTELVMDGDYGMMRFGAATFPFPPTSGLLDRSRAWRMYCPITLLKTVSKGATLTYRGEEKVSGVPHHAIAFKAVGLSGKLLINANTMLLSEAWLDTAWPTEFYFSIWGRFTTRIQYSIYALYGGNRFYPLQWNITTNDLPWQQVTIHALEFRQNTDDGTFAIPEEVKAKQSPPKKVADLVPAVAQVKEVAPGISLIKGNWNTGWIEQEDGIVVLEAPISSGYSKQVIEAVKARFPGKPIKGVVVSSDAWPHLGGAREYMAARIPVYSSYLNEGILTRLAHADYAPQSDALQATKRKPEFRWVNSPVAFDDKNNPFTIYPVNGEGGERMVVVYFPKQKVLYASDLVQYADAARKDFFFPEYLHEVRAVIRRYHLEVDTVYAMHLEPTPWTKVEEFLEGVSR